jgi:hypothetical protein
VIWLRVVVVHPPFSTDDRKTRNEFKGAAHPQRRRRKKNRPHTET